jgi:hypothetical protein
MAAVNHMNPVQLHLLQFFSQKDVSEQETEDIQRMISQYYFDKAETELEKVLQEKQISETVIDNLANVHLRTPYIKK